MQPRRQHRCGMQEWWRNWRVAQRKVFPYDHEQQIVFAWKLWQQQSDGDIKHFLGSYKCFTNWKCIQNYSNRDAFQWQVVWNLRSPDRDRTWLYDSSITLARHTLQEPVVKWSHDRNVPEQKNLLQTSLLSPRLLFRLGWSFRSDQSLLSLLASNH